MGCGWGGALAFRGAAACPQYSCDEYAGYSSTASVGSSCCYSVSRGRREVERSSMQQGMLHLWSVLITICVQGLRYFTVRYQAEHFHLIRFRMIIECCYLSRLCHQVKTCLNVAWLGNDHSLARVKYLRNASLQIARCHSVMHICLTSDSALLSWKTRADCWLLREREHLRIFFRTPFCASAQWQKNLLSIKVINCLIGGVSNPHCKICLCQIHKTLIFFVCCLLSKPPVVWSCSLTSPCYQAEVCASRDGVCLPFVSHVLSLPQQGSSASDVGTPHPSWPSVWATWGSQWIL